MPRSARLNAIEEQHQPERAADVTHVVAAGGRGELVGRVLPCRQLSEAPRQAAQERANVGQCAQRHRDPGDDDLGRGAAVIRTSLAAYNRAAPGALL
jgi:hypothetical protein